MIGQVSAQHSTVAFSLSKHNWAACTDNFVAASESSPDWNWTTEDSLSEVGIDMTFILRFQSLHVQATVSKWNL